MSDVPTNMVAVVRSVYTLNRPPHLVSFDLEKLSGVLLGCIFCGVASGMGTTLGYLSIL